MATILLIDDEESVRMIFQVALERAGYRKAKADELLQATSALIAHLMR